MNKQKEVRFVGGPLDGQTRDGVPMCHGYSVPIVSKAGLYNAAMALPEDAPMPWFPPDHPWEHIPACFKEAYYERRSGCNGNGQMVSEFYFVGIHLTRKPEDIRECLERLRWSEARIKVALSTEWPEPDMERDA